VLLPVQVPYLWLRTSSCVTSSSALLLPGVRRSDPKAFLLHRFGPLRASISKAVSPMRAVIRWPPSVTTSGGYVSGQSRNKHHANDPPKPFRCIAFSLVVGLSRSIAVRNRRHVCSLSRRSAMAVPVTVFGGHFASPNALQRSMRAAVRVIDAGIMRLLAWSNAAIEWYYAAPRRRWIKRGRGA
jgi:hypothetical protein